jgi:MoaA/NifB/PqqE/SkfB family radical SAM enzyme
MWCATEKAGGGRLHEILVAAEEIARRRSDVGSVARGLDLFRIPLWECLSERLDATVAKAVALKVLNLCLAKYHFRARHSQVLSRPFGLIVDPSNFCNLACPGCVHSQHSQELKIFDWENGRMPEARVAALLRTHGPYAIQTNFSNYGEPLMNPDTPSFIRMAKSYVMRAMLSTNLAVGRFDAEALVLSGLDHMVMSIDGATQGVYERFRRNGKLDTVLHNVRRLVEAKRRLGRKAPVMAWHFLAFEHNAHEIPQALELARQLGVDRFVALTPFDVSWDDPAIRVAAVEPVTVEIEDYDTGAMADNLLAPPGGLDAEGIEREFAGRWSDRARGMEAGGGSSPMTCQWLYQSMSMDARGRVFPCCGAPTRDRDLVFGKFDSGGDVYNSAKYQAARLSFAGGGGPESYCSRCEWRKDNPNAGAAEVREFLETAGLGWWRSGDLDG